MTEARKHGRPGKFRRAAGFVIENLPASSPLWQAVRCAWLAWPTSSPEGRSKWT